MKKSLLKICFIPLSWWNKIKRKQDNLIFFYSNLGFRDNVRALYDYMIENNYNDEMEFVVSINEWEKYAKNAPKNVTFVSTKGGIKHFLRARYAFYCFGKYPIKPAKTQTVINLWHGTPLKRIGNLESGKEKVNYHYFTNVVTASSSYKSIMSRIFSCDRSEVDVLGNPRNDEMFEKNDITDKSIRLGAKKLIVWLPTYREYDDSFFVSVLKEGQMDELNRYLKQQECRMIIKLHPMQKLPDMKLKFSNINIYSDDDLLDHGMTVYTLLRNADGLITDYSSVYFDFLLMDKPIGFAVDDLDEYKNKRGLIFDNPEEYMPGPMIKSLEDIEQFINMLVFEVDNYRMERERVNNMVNDFQDGMSSQRIIDCYIKL